MSELVDTEEKKRKTIECIVKDPLKYLRDNRKRGKSCLECLVFLQQVRNAIQADTSYAIVKPHPVYALFHRSSNGTVEHYVALFNLLKDADFSKIEVNDAIMDFLPDKHKDEPHGATVRAYLSLTTKALDLVYSRS